MGLTKVFKIELTGGRDVQKDIVAVKKEITNFARSTKEAKQQLALLFSGGGDEAAIKALQQNIAELERKMRALGQQRNNLENDAKAQAQAEKLLAEALLKEAQATKALEQANLARLQAEIAQEKELDRKIALEEKERQAIERKKKVLDGLPGSYNTIKNALAQLKPFVNSGGLGGTVNFNGQQLNFDQALAEFKKLSAAEQEFRRQFAKDGTLVGEYATGIVDAFKKMNIDDIIRGQVTGARQQLEILENKSKELVVAYRQAQTQGSADLNKLQKEIHDNVVETERLRKGILQAEVQLRGMGGIGDQVTNALDRNFKSLKNNISQFALQFVGFQALFSGIQQGIGTAKELSDQTTELEIQLGKSAGGASKLVSELAKLDTRTKLGVLEEIANIALKAGVSEQNLLGVTKAIDTVKLAFGKDFGDIEQGTETFVKLINIFYEDGEVTEERILKMGNAIRGIANESVASVPFINDFAGRMAGVKQIANVTLPQIIGLGAGFEEFKQSAEVSSTVLVKLIPLMAKNLDKFAEVAGVTREEFKKLVDENPIEALLQLSQGLQKSGDIEGFSKALGDIGVEAGRATTIIATLGGKADTFRKRIESANEKSEQMGEITAAAAQKNENLAATLDKISKKFADATGSKEFQTALLVLSSIITVLIGNIGTVLIPLIIGATAFTNTWAGSIIRLTAAKSLEIGALLVEKAQLVATNALRAAAAVITNVYAAATIRSAAASGAAAVAYRILAGTIALITGPLGITIGLVVALTTVFGILSASAKSVTKSLSEQARLKKINAEIDREVVKSTSAQISALDGWIAVVKSASTSADTKRKAMEKLVELNPAFRGAITGQTQDLVKLDEIYGKIVKSIQAKARVEAASTLAAKRQSRVTEISALRQDLEIQVAQNRSGQSITDVDLTDSEIDLLKQTDLQNSGAIVTFIGNRAQILTSRFNEVRKFLEQKEGEAIRIYQDYLTAQARAQEELSKLEQQVTTQQQANAASVSKTFEVDIAKLKEQIAALDKQIEGFQGSKADLTKIIADRKKLQDQLDALLGRGGKGSDRASRLSGSEKDRFKEIDALRDEELATAKKQFTELEIEERDYLFRVLRINERAINSKIELLRRQKTLNAEEKKIIADLNLEKITNVQQTNEKLFELDNKRIEVSLRNQKLAAQQQLDITQANPDLTNTQALQAREDYYNKLLQAQIVFNQKQIALEKLFGVASIENEQKRKEAIEAINKELEAIMRAGPDARQKDIQDALDKQLSEIQANIQQRTTAILESNKSYTRKAREIAKVELEETKRVLAARHAAAQIAFDDAEKLRKAGLISEKEYLKRLEELKTAEAALYKFTTNEQVSSTQRLILALKELGSQFLETALGIKSYTKDAAGEQQRINDSITQSVGVVREAINQAYEGYFKNEEARIDRQKQFDLDFLDREKKRVLATATSAAERETIERQFDKKRKAVEKKAGEEKKANAMKQAAIDFAIAVIKTFAQFGFPLGLIPVAGLTLAYFIQRSAIQKQQFERGGSLKRKRLYGLGGEAGKVPVKGGVFGGKSHAQGGTDFSFNGQQYNAEVGEMNIIRTKNAPKNKRYTITGQHNQIASALNTLGGGVSFAPGAAIRKFDTGGQLGTTLRPPTFTNGFNSSSVNSATQVNNDMENLKLIVADLAQVVMASDQKEVVLNPNKVTKAQERKRKDVNVGTI